MTLNVDGCDVEKY